MDSKLPISVLNYSSYKDFLLDAYEYSHSQNESISYELLASTCGFKSRTQARNIIKGTQSPNFEQLEKISDFFLLDEKEKKYLLCLFKFQDARSNPMAYELFEQLMQMQKNEKSTRPNPFKDIEVMTSVLHMTLLSVFEFNKKIKITDMPSLLKNKFKLEEIGQAINDLIELKFVCFDEKTNEWVLLQKHIRKYDYNSNFFLRKFHNECLDIAKKALNEEPTSERYLIGASFVINHKVFPRIVQKINAFIENLMLQDNVGGIPDTVVQFNGQFIKMTETETIEKQRVLGPQTAERVLS